MVFEEIMALNLPVAPLVTFLDLMQTHSFGVTARHLRLSSSSVSVHIANLEKHIGALLFTRTRGPRALVEPTAAGVELARLAAPIVAAHAAASEHFRPTSDNGRVRLAMADDIAASRNVGDALRGFRLRNPGVQVEITIGQSGALRRRVRAGHFDIALIKRMPSAEPAHILRTEQITWTVHPDAAFDLATSVPLVAYPTSSFLRNHAVSVLNTAGRGWHIANTVRGVNGALTAVRAGLGIGVFGTGMLPPDLAAAPASWALPELGAVETVIVTGDNLAAPTQRLERSLVGWGSDLLP